MKNLLILICLLLTSVSTMAKDWRWQLSAERYKKMNAFERALYDKGREAFERGEYRAAATAFEKFKVEHEESFLLSYAIFMQGLSLHHAKDRGKAIRAYNEVLDYFGDIVEDAGPALYFLGKAHFDNGDKKKGMLAMKEMVEDQDYSKHPLAAGALDELANNYWANKEKELAVKYWKQVVNDFSKTNRSQAEKSRHSVYLYYTEEDRIPEIVSWLLRDSKSQGEQLSKERADIAYEVSKVVLNDLRHNSRYRQAKYKKLQTKQAQSLWNYLSSEKEHFKKSGKLWNFLRSALHVTGAFLSEKKTVDDLLAEAQNYIKGIKEPENRDRHIDRLADFLQDYVDIARAIHTIQSHSNQNYAEYKKAWYLHRWDKQQEAVEQFKKCESMPDKKLAMESMIQRAHILRERLNKQDDAIKLYKEISQPPMTLWCLADCYRRKKDHKMALATWKEIESSFPKEAPSASWHRADHYQKMGENKLAVAEARSLLKRYPKSRESSAAHQLLEAYGVKTGGGVEE